MGAVDNCAAAEAAFKGIPRSPLIREPVFGAKLHTYCIRNAVVQPPRE